MYYEIIELDIFIEYFIIVNVLMVVGVGKGENG